MDGVDRPLKNYTNHEAVDSEIRPINDKNDMARAGLCSRMLTVFAAVFLPPGGLIVASVPDIG